MGFPGTLPVINERAVEYTVMTALALNCEIPEFSKFDRKNYFYPDLPKGYQISQYDMPLSRNGYLTIQLDGEEQRIGITRVHLEEDTGRHLIALRARRGVQPGGPQPRGRAADGDRRRAGHAQRRGGAALHREAALDPASTSASTPARMEEGALRCDANISRAPARPEGVRRKVEIKNMNSFRAVERALVYEAARQLEELQAGRTIVQETRGWREDKGVTVLQRGKEFADDYRYFPEPDLPPLTFSRERVEEIRARMPELPDAKRERFVAQYGLSAYDAEQLTAERAVADYFESVVTMGDERKESERSARAKMAANWINGELRRLLNAAGQEIGASRVTPAGLAELLDLVERGTISGKQAKDVLELAFTSGDAPAEIVAREGLSQMSDGGELEQIVVEVIAENPKAVEDYRAGKTAAVQFLVGQVMKRTKGRAKPDAVQPLLLGKLDQS